MSNDQVLRYVIDGGVMERPENCPDKLYGLMQLTWKRPDTRPTFLQLVSMLSGEATQEFREHSFFYSEEGQDLYHQVLPAGKHSIIQTFKIIMQMDSSRVDDYKINDYTGHMIEVK